tara:strand:+ start:666 stop:1238 length:573 start_codon:yes stop_codon:yes gene_type:complete
MNKLADITLKSLKSDPMLIKNPFTCGSSRPIRLTLDKLPPMKVGDTTYVKVIPFGETTVIQNELEPRLNYTFTKTAEEVKFTDVNIIGSEGFDYNMPADALNKNRTDGKEPHTDGLKLSFIQISNESDGIEWYMKHYPKIPTDLLPIIARYHWGDPISKKGIKNEKKKIEKKLGQAGLKVSHGTTTVSFD